MCCKDSRDGGEMELFQGTPFSPISKQYKLPRQMDIKVYTINGAKTHIYIHDWDIGNINLKIHKKSN